MPAVNRAHELREDELLTAVAAIYYLNDATQAELG
jgi:hypothetical protein